MWKFAYNSSSYANQNIPSSFAVAYKKLDIMVTFKGTVEHHVFYSLLISKEYSKMSVC